MIPVVDVRPARIRDRENLPNALRPRGSIWRRAAVVVRGALVGIPNRIDIPIGVITQMRAVPSKIGIVRQELLRAGPLKPIGQPSGSVWDRAKRRSV